MDIKELQDRQAVLGMNNKQFAAFLGIHEKSWSRIKRRGVITPRLEKLLAGMFTPCGMPTENPYWADTNGGWPKFPEENPGLIDRIKGWFKW